MKRYLFIALALLTLALSGPALFGGCSAPGSDSGVKAAIVDQLYVLWPNEEFITEVTQDLEAYGFEVDVYRGEEVSVKFYKELPKQGYKLIIFRAHAGLLQQPVPGSEAVPRESTYLFTAEVYSKSKYIREQLTDQMVPATMEGDYPSVFAINSKYVMESMEGRFQNTVIIMMGCSANYRGDLAAAFTLQGASIYLGWPSTVGLNYVDTATMNLIDNLSIKNMTFKQAVAETMREVGPDPDYHGPLQFYPPESSSQTIRELIGRTARY